jgi:hypothetical protein
MLVWSPLEPLLLPLADRSGNGALGAAVPQQQGEQIPLRFALLAPLLSSVAPLFSGRALLLLPGSPHVGGHSHGAIVFAVKLDVKAVRQGALQVQGLESHVQVSHFQRL